MAIDNNDNNNDEYSESFALMIKIVISVYDYRVGACWSVLCRCVCMNLHPGMCMFIQIDEHRQLLNGISV